jgi:hypothetical protein
MEARESQRKPNMRDIRRKYGLTSRAVADAAGVELQIEYLLEIGGLVSKQEVEKMLEALSRLTGEHFTTENVSDICVPPNRITKAPPQVNIMH